MNKNRPGGVYYDLHSPARLAAVARGDVHYAGDTCFRGHVGLRFAKTGKCVQCAHEDRRTYSKTAKGKRYQRVRDHRRHIRIRKGERRLGPNIVKVWADRLRMYNLAVEHGGYPITEGEPLNVRVNNFWRAYLEVTTDVPPVKDPSLRLRRREQAERWRLYNTVWLAAFLENREFDRERNRIFDAARRAARRAAHLEVKQRNGIPVTEDLPTEVALCKAAGLNLSTVRSRVYAHGWTWERALSTPAGKTYIR